jgi:hypothetical protein
MSADLAALESLIENLDDDEREALIDKLRPREWLVSWRYKEDMAWLGTERTWQSEYEAVRHGRALQAMCVATDEIRAVLIQSRARLLRETEWTEHYGWCEAPALELSEPL